MKISIFRASALALFAAVALTAPAFANTTTDTLVRQSSVTIQTPMQTPHGTMYALDGGAIVGTDSTGLIVLTAAHAVEVNPHGGPATSADLVKPGIQVWTADRQAALNVMSVEFVQGHDEAIVHTSMPFGVFAAPGVSAVPPTMGQPLTVIGSPYGKAFTVSSAHAISPMILPKTATGSIAIMCANCYEGDSGGGVFDASGSLVGVLTGAYSDKSGAVVAIEVESWQPALEMLSCESQTTKASYCTAQTAPIMGKIAAAQ